MTPEIQIAVIASGSALIGSLIGGAVSYFTTIQSSRISWRYTQLEKQIESLTAIHGEFLAEACRITLLAIDKKFSGVIDFALLHTLMSRIRIISDDATVKAASDVAKAAMQQHSSDKAKQAQEDFATFTKKMCECSRREIQLLRNSA